MIFRGVSLSLSLFLYGLAITMSFYVFSFSSSSQLHINEHDLCGLEVFSHRGATMNSQHAPGSYGSVKYLLENGICSFDVDCFETLDHELVIGHPMEIMKRLHLENLPTTKTLLELHNLDNFQLLLVKDFFRLVSSGRHCDQQSHHNTKLSLLIEPKGDSASLKTIDLIASLADEFNFKLGEVGVWLSDRSLVVRFKNTNLLPLAPVKNGLESTAPPPFVAVGPSIQHEGLLEVVTQATAVGQEVIAWVVDHPQELDIIDGLEVAGIVSNNPIRMTQYLAKICKR